MITDTQYDLWRVTIRNRRGIVATATFQFEISALHFSIDYLAHYSARRKHVSIFIAGPETNYEYHG